MKCLAVLLMLGLLVTTSAFTFPPIIPALTRMGSSRGKGLLSLSEEESAKFYPNTEMSDMAQSDGRKALSRVTKEPLSRHDTSRSKAIEQNKRIMEFGIRRDWRGLLQYADENRNEFNNVNWATMWSKLRGMRREAMVIKNDKVFNRVREDFERRIEDDGMGWLGVHGVANVVHAYAVMGIRGSAFVEAVESEDVVTKIMSEGKPQAIANTIWAMARMGHEAEPITFLHPSVSFSVTGFIPQ